MSNPPNPDDRMGVFKRIEDVPAEYRLEKLAPEYKGRDTFAEYLVAEGYDEPASDRAKYDLRCAYKWVYHMNDRGRHPALAHPDDVEAFFADLLDRMKPFRAYYPYWARVDGFYEWLLWHVDHEHVYNPVRMAAATGEATAKVWVARVNA